MSNKMTPEKMTPEQEEHLQGLKDSFCARLDTKYRAGVKEHGGNVWDLTKAQLHKEATMEVMDLWVYMNTLGRD